MSPVRVGILHSLSGTMAISEAPLVEAALMAIAEINQRGGVLGQPIEAIVEDGASDAVWFAGKARKLLEENNITTVFGCWTSASRKAVKPLFEALNGLLWYPVPYEGLESSPNIFYIGSCANQQVEPAVTWLLQNQGQRFYLLGSDEIFSHTAHKIVTAQLKHQGGRVIGQKYLPLGTNDFAEIITNIEQLRPDVVFNTLNGDSNLAFYRQYQASGITPADIPILTVRVAEPELQQLGEAAAGHYAAWSYFQSLNTPQNRQFVQNFQALYGLNRVTSDPIETAYTQVYLWQQAVELAESVAVERVRVAAYGQSFEAPGGLVRIEPNHHVGKACRIGKILPNGQVEVVFSTDQLIKPLPWLGIETVNFSGKEIAMNLLAEVPPIIETACQLEQKTRQLKREINQYKRAEEEVELLLDITRAISAASDFEEALEVALRQLCKATSWSIGEAWVPSADGTVLEYSRSWYCHPTGQDDALVGAVERFREHSQKITRRPNEGLPGRVWYRGQPEWIPDVSVESSSLFLRAQLSKECGIKAEFGVPIIAGRRMGEKGREGKIQKHSSSHPEGDLSSLADGQVLAVLVFFMQESRQQEQRLVELVSAVAAQLGTVMQHLSAEAELRALFEAMNDVIVVLDRQGRYLKIAPTQPEYLYKPTGELLGKTMHEVFERSLADKFLGHIRDALENQRTVNFEYHLNLEERLAADLVTDVADGVGELVRYELSLGVDSSVTSARKSFVNPKSRDVWFAASVSPISQDSAIWVARDITAHRRAGEELRASERKFRTLIERMNEGLSIVDNQGVIEFVNDRFCEMVGYDRDELIGRYEEELAATAADRRLLQAKRNLRQQGVFDQYEIQLQSKSGLPLWVLGISTPVFDAEEKPIGAMITLNDITESKQAEEALRAEQQKSERLLLNILPQVIAEQLKQNHSELVKGTISAPIASLFDEATILFADIVRFTPLSARMSPTALVNLLNQIFSAFDQLSDRYGLEKIKTIGDAYMVVGGLPIPRLDHAEAIAEMALDMQKISGHFKRDDGEPFYLRIGIHTGPVVAGVIGLRKFIYDLWGDTVNVAARMESQGIAGGIQVTAATYERLKDKYVLEKRGAIAVKGKGEMMTYWLTERKVNS